VQEKPFYACAPRMGRLKNPSAHPTGDIARFCNHLPPNHQQPAQQLCAPPVTPFLQHSHPTHCEETSSVHAHESSGKEWHPHTEALPA